MPEIRFTEEDHAFAQEFVDRLESSGVAGTVREFLSKEDADWLLFHADLALSIFEKPVTRERELRSSSDIARRLS